MQLFFSRVNCYLQPFLSNILFGLCLKQKAVPFHFATAQHFPVSNNFNKLISIIPNLLWGFENIVKYVKLICSNKYYNIEFPKTNFLNEEPAFHSNLQILQYIRKRWGMFVIWQYMTYWQRKPFSMNKVILKAEK